MQVRNSICLPGCLSVCLSVCMCIYVGCTALDCTGLDWTVLQFMSLLAGFAGFAVSVLIILWAENRAPYESTASGYTKDVCF